MLKKLFGNKKPEMPVADILSWLEEGQFGRYVMYQEIMKFIQKEFHEKKHSHAKLIELGGSNTLIRHMFNDPEFEVAPNYPEVDVTNLSAYQENRYDFAIMDQVLEHVSDPLKAISEVRRILKKDGWFINTTPFLIEIHEVPFDYWRFTKDGLKQLFRDFSQVEITSWGNKKTVLWQIESERWPTVAEARASNHFDLENDEKFPIVYWVFAKK